MRENVDKLWLNCSEEVKESYGDAYIEDFKSTLTQHLLKAFPEHMISEVVKDMTHAIAGVEPKVSVLISEMQPKV